MNDSAVPFLSQVALPRSSVHAGILMKLDAFLRRGLDILVALAGLIFLAPFFAWIALRIHQDSPGPVFYRGPRAGRGGRIFGILKFRTMYENPESYQGAKVTAQDDPRITPLGKWLRATKLNELPQLWNVLAGDMSLVGPRPEDPTIVAKWPESLQREILSVRPGITSPATILFRDEENRLQTGSVMDDYLRMIMPSKLRLDTLYIANRSILSDLDVILWTSVVLLPVLRRIPIPEHRLYQGPLSLFTSRFLVWFLIDSLIALAAVSVTGLVWRMSGPLEVGLELAVWLALGIAAFFGIVNTIFGLSEVEWSRAPASDAIVLALSSAIVTAILILLDGYALKKPLLPQPMLVETGVLSLAGFVTIRYRERLMTGLASRWLNARGGAGAVGERVLMVGAGHNCKMVNWYLSQSKISRAFTIAGIVDDDPRKQGKKYEGHRVLGSTQDIPAIARKYDIGLIFFTISNITPADRERILETCQQTQTIVIILPDIMETLQEKFQVANTMLFHDGASPSSEREQRAAELAELDLLAQQGDFEQLRRRIQEMRGEDSEGNG